MKYQLLLSDFVAALIALWCVARANPKAFQRFTRLKPEVWMFFALGAVAVVLMSLGPNASWLEASGGSMAMAAVLIAPEEFQEKVLKGIGDTATKIEEIGEDVKAVETKAETLLKNYDQLDGKTKGLMEDITKLKKVANDSQSNADLILKKFGLFEVQLRNEMRQAFGDPIKRVQND